MHEAGWQLGCPSDSGKPYCIWLLTSTSSGAGEVAVAFPTTPPVAHMQHDQQDTISLAQATSPSQSMNAQGPDIAGELISCLVQGGLKAQHVCCQSHLYSAIGAISSRIGTPTLHKLLLPYNVATSRPSTRSASTCATMSTANVMRLTFNHPQAWENCLAASRLA